MPEVLQEAVPTIYEDRIYRRTDRLILIASIMSVLPKEGGMIDPGVWGSANGDYTWDRVASFMIAHPMSRNRQLPMHYYTELLRMDYVTFVGLPLTNRSWFLEEAVRAGALPYAYMDAILVVLQENFAIDPPEKRMWKMLSHSVLSPLMREFSIPRSNVGFFELTANRKVLESDEWKFMFREPTYLDPVQLEMVLRNYEKR